MIIQALTYSLASLIDGEQPSFNPAHSRATHIYSAQCLTPEHMPLSPLMVHELDDDDHRNTSLTYNKTLRLANWSVSQSALHGSVHARVNMAVDTVADHAQ